MKKKNIIITVAIIVLVSFLAWRFIRPMNIFVVEGEFAWPVDTSQVPAVLGNLSAKECGGCHEDFYKEWQTTIHSQAWTDPYFQADWKFDDKQHICRLCHTPLDRQQPHKVLGYRDKDKWYPIMEDNPDFDPALQHEGVTCAACHFRDGKIVGVLGNTDAPHPVKKLDDPNQVCVRCHVVDGDRWDTFFRFPPCGTVAEIKATPVTDPEKNIASITKGKTGEVTVSNTRSLGCVQCHMPLLERPLVTGGKVRMTRQHLWRGGHDPEMVKKALTIKFIETDQPQKDKRIFRLTITNTGAAHYVPTGTPDRHFTATLRSLDNNGNIIDEQEYTLKRTVMWRPFIIDLWDTRLPRWQPRQYELEIVNDSKAVEIEAEIRYHLVDDKRRKRIEYKNKTPINYEVFRKKIVLESDVRNTTPSIK